MPNALITGIQVCSLLLLSLVAGAVFGIWRGYDPSAFSAATFVEVHQGAVKGLNVLLPAMAAASLLLTVALGYFARHPAALWLYVLVAVAIVAGGLITRFGNQPINAEVMRWTADTMPAGWAQLRDMWWRWHAIRLVTTVCALILLILAVFADRDGRAVSRDDRLGSANMADRQS